MLMLYVTFVLVDTFVVHADVVYQPSNVYPVLVPVASVPYVLLKVTFFCVGFIDAVAPDGKFELKYNTQFVFGVHLAYNVSFAET